MEIFDFEITSELEISKRLRTIGIHNFLGAATWVEQLPYRRNKDKNSPTGILDERCGTCSTKHALLKRLADENGFGELKLIVGLYKMHARNTPGISRVLENHQLAYLPEAHTYLKINAQILDFTGLNIGEDTPFAQILTQKEIVPDQVADFKIKFHRDYLTQWLIEEGMPYSLDEIWKIREDCIQAIAHKQMALTTERLHMRPFCGDDDVQA